ncbi:hypothetical protein O7623_19075 [Solwaraspora sp. WMMD791]|uniref:hypothetical protein n=1 Tax=Solwaraspora sp. WMMD791 TaxID=3016086 RepID=UPI00249A68FC|nr:hypothetical protein [Solwaraspora sp. WMMD791]WFE25488.1 hypothetical protein O7623_19075 [Solwaraspora sp. WMMD791]
MSHTDDPPALLWRMLRDATVVATQDALVLVTDGALAHPTCGAVLRQVVRHATRTLDARRIWIDAEGIGRPGNDHASWLLRLATHVQVELLAPDGPSYLTVDGSRYVGSGTGAGGWWSFRAGAAPGVVANRFPPPPWEAALPDHPIGLPGLVADPIPAGLLLRATDMATVGPTDPAFDVPVDSRGPALVLRHVGEPPVEPTQLAALFAGLPARTTVRVELGLLDPAWAQPRPQWLDRLSVALDAVLDGGQLTAVPESVGRRRSTQPPPALLDTGWARVGDRHYRHTAEPLLMAEVSATGILLRTADEFRRANLAFIDPASGMLRLDVAASPSLVAALCRVVTMAPDGLQIDVDPEHPATAQLAASLRQPPAAAPVEDPVGKRYVNRPVAAPAPATPAPTVMPASTATPAPAVVPASTATPAPAPQAVAVAPPAGPTPPPSVAPAPVPVPSPSAAPPAAPPSFAHPPVITSSGPDPDMPADDRPDGIPPTVDELPPAVVPLPATSAGESASAQSDRAGPADRYVPAAGIAVPDRDSTPAEQREFTAALGPAYTDSITTVNAALAAWPSLRQDISATAKTDLVAVRVYFGRSELGAARLNAGLRAGRQPELASYLSCLVSGLRRLPPCRRAMLCQSRLVVPARQLYSEGATLVEPGFRSVSGAGLAVEGADVDYLVWSRTARQAGALAERQELDEAVFLAGARFKVLAVREGSPPPAEDVTVPTTAVLLREMLPGEPDTSGLGEVDRTALSRLERALRRRWSVAPQALTDEDAIDRLAGPPLGYLEPDAATAVPDGAQH